MITNFKWSAGIWMLFFDFFFWFAIGLWFDQIWLREYGERKPFYFCCTPKWWGCSKNRRQLTEEEEDRRSALLRHTDEAGRPSNNMINDDFESKHLKETNYEAVAPEIARLEIDN